MTCHHLLLTLPSSLCSPFDGLEFICTVHINLSALGFQILSAAIDIQISQLVPYVDLHAI